MLHNTFEFSSPKVQKSSEKDEEDGQNNSDILVVFRYSIASNGCNIHRNVMERNENEQQFSRLVREQKSTIYTVCYMFSKDEDEVAELFQETLVNLWNGFGSFEGRSDIRTWVYRVALNTCLSADRKKKRRKTVPLTMNVNLFDDTDADSRQVQMLRRRISRLAPFDRAIVLLWLENMSYEEIGLVVGISTKNVSVRLYRIKEQLKNMSND